MTAKAADMLRRGMEVFSAYTFIMIVLWAEIVSLTIFIAIFLYGGTYGRAFCVLYLIYFYHDRKAHGDYSRGQGNKHMRNWVIWRHFTKYFPAHLIKTAELSPSRNYIFAVFPHGVISCSSVCHFVTSTTNFSELFPGIRTKLCTLNFHFFVPLFREITLGWGMMSAKSKCIRNTLSQPNEKSAPCNADGYTSNAVVIVVGGAKEALHARPGNYKIVLKDRKGFCRIAIQTGATLVPVFSFNEVELFDQPSNEPGSRLRRFQDFTKKWTGIAPACFIGRGFLKNSYGLIPHRHPLYTVIGAPIEPSNPTPTPSKSDIDELHERFTEALVKLFEDHKHKYLKNADKIRLVIE